MKMKEFKIPMPTKMVRLGKIYVKNKKRHGDNIAKFKGENKFF